MEVGSSFGVEFGFNPKFTAQEKIFDLYVYEVREYFLVITYTAHVVTVRKSNGGILWWRKEWDEIDYISYTRKVYLLQTPVEVVFEYTVR